MYKKLSLLGVLVFVVLAALLASPIKNYLSAQTGTPRPLTGFGWSSNIGWVSFSSTNDHNETVTGAQPSVPAYGVYLQPDGRLTGEAWSANLGWLKFDSAGTFPEAPTVTARLSADRVIGWARFLSPIPGVQTGGWDGWLKLSGTAKDGTEYKVTREVVNNREKLNGFAWGDLVVGWLNMDQVYIGANCTPGTAGCPPIPCVDGVNCPEVCDGRDNDGDKDIDEGCGTGNCTTGQNCERCDDTIDNDGDLLINEDCPNSPKLTVIIQGTPYGSVNVPGKPYGWCEKLRDIGSKTCPAATEQVYRVSGTVRLVASATDFSSWTGDCISSSPTCSVTMNADKTVIASYGSQTGNANFTLRFSASEIGVANPPPPPGSICPTGLNQPSQYDHCSGYSTISVVWAPGSTPRVVRLSAPNSGLPGGTGEPKIYFNRPGSSAFAETVDLQPGQTVNVRTYFANRAVTPLDADIVSPYAKSRTAANPLSANVPLTISAQALQNGVPTGAVITGTINHVYRDLRGSGF